jgi:hypothetical protein
MALDSGTTEQTISSALQVSVSKEAGGKAAKVRLSSGSIATRMHLNIGSALLGLATVLAFRWLTVCPEFPIATPARGLVLGAGTILVGWLVGFGLPPAVSRLLPQLSELVIHKMSHRSAAST